MTTPSCRATRRSQWPPLPDVGPEGGIIGASGGGTITGTLIANNSPTCSALESRRLSARSGLAVWLPAGCWTESPVACGGLAGGGSRGAVLLRERDVRFSSDGHQAVVAEHETAKSTPDEAVPTVGVAVQSAPFQLRHGVILVWDLTGSEDANCLTFRTRDTGEGVATDVSLRQGGHRLAGPRGSVPRPAVVLATAEGHARTRGTPARRCDRGPRLREYPRVGSPRRAVPDLYYEPREEYPTATHSVPAPTPGDVASWPLVPLSGGLIDQLAPFQRSASIVVAPPIRVADGCAWGPRRKRSSTWSAASLRAPMVSIGSTSCRSNARRGVSLCRNSPPPCSWSRCCRTRLAEGSLSKALGRERQLSS